MTCRLTLAMLNRQSVSVIRRRSKTAFLRGVRHEVIPPARAREAER